APGWRTRFIPLVGLKGKTKVNNSTTISLEGEHVAMPEPGEPSSERSGEEGRSNRLSVGEIARRLDLGRLAVYAMLERGILPGIRLAPRSIITPHTSNQCIRHSGRHPC